MKKRGLHPLPVHLGLALSQHMPIPAAAHNHGLTKQELEQMMQGIKMYETYPHQLRRARRYVPFKMQQSKIYCAKPYDKMRNMDDCPLLLIPSLINSEEIFDLNKQYSFLRWLTEQNRPTYVLAWDKFSKEEMQNIHIKEIIHGQLAQNIKSVAESLNRPIDVMGYCMGGTLLMGAYDAIKDYVRRIILLAAPWDFHAPQMSLTTHIAAWAPTAMPGVVQRGYLPARWSQGLFAGIDPYATAQKFIRFSKMNIDSQEAELFVRVEDWLNNGADLPAPLVHHCVMEWFIKNAPFNETWRCDKKPVMLSKIDKDVLIVASKKDKLVPFSSAVAVQKFLNAAHANVLEAKCGHIGFMAGRTTKENVWRHILDWLQA